MELRIDGKRVYAATGGKPFDPARPSVVFLHAAGMDHTAWALQTRYFANHGRSVLALDLPGHGRSEGPPLATIADLAQWLLRTIEGAGLDQAALVGHSLGSLVALEAAAGGAGCVWALALLATAMPMAVNDDLLAGAAANQHVAFELITSWGHSRTAQRGGSRPPGLWMMGGTLRLLKRSGRGVLHTDLAAAAAYTQGLDAAARVRCPTLLLLGEHDRMTPPAAAKALGEAITGAETIVLPGCGHIMMEEQPDRVLDALIELV